MSHDMGPMGAHDDMGARGGVVCRRLWRRRKISQCPPLPIGNTFFPFRRDIIKCVWGDFEQEALRGYLYLTISRSPISGPVLWMCDSLSPAAPLSHPMIHISRTLTIRQVRYKVQVWDSKLHAHYKLAPLAGTLQLHHPIRSSPFQSPSNAQSTKL